MTGCRRPSVRGLARTSRNATRPHTATETSSTAHHGRPADATTSVMHTVAVISASSRTNAAADATRARVLGQRAHAAGGGVPLGEQLGHRGARDAHDGHLARGERGGGGDAEHREQDEQRDGDVRHREARNVSSSWRWSANISFSSSGSAWS